MRDIISRELLKIKHQVCDVKIIDIFNSRDDIKIGEVVWVVTRRNYPPIPQEGDSFHE